MNFVQRSLNLYEFIWIYMIKYEFIWIYLIMMKYSYDLMNLGDEICSVILDAFETALKWSPTRQGKSETIEAD
jgi:hypothetical protein